MTGIQPAVIAISGPIGSGKTTITTLLSQRIGWPRTAYGDLVRAIATRRGLTCDRRHLQHIGSQLVADGWDAFTRRVLSQAAWRPGDSLIVDGLRHPGAVTALQRITAPCPSSSSTWTSQPTPGSPAHASGTTFPPARAAETKPTPSSRNFRPSAARPASSCPSMTAPLA